MEKDSFLWLEEVEGEKALSWVKEHNQITLDELTSGKRFRDLQDLALKELESKDRIPDVSLRGSYVYNFWQDDKNVRGLWRRTSVESLKRRSPEWETLLDIDNLADRESKNWVYKGAELLLPQRRYALVHLSLGGKDAAEVREFDLVEKKFVKGGFYLPEAKSTVGWLNHDFIFVGTDFGEGSLTSSGYPRCVKLWKRGTPIEEASLVMEAKKTDMLVYGQHLERSQGSVHCSCSCAGDL